MSISKSIIASGTAVLSVAAIASPGAGAKLSSATVMCRTGNGAPCVYAGATKSCRHLSRKPGQPGCASVVRERW